MMLHQQIKTKTFIPVCPYKPKASQISNQSEFTIQAANILIMTNTDATEPQVGTSAAVKRHRAPHTSVCAASVDVLLLGGDTYRIRCVAHAI